MPAPRLTPAATATDAALILGAAARLTRLVTTDSIGDRYLVRPAEEWAERNDALVTHVHADGTEKEGWRTFLVSGLTCPFCCGYHVGVLTLASYALARRRPATLAAWRAIASTLAANYVVGHVSARLD